MASIAIVLISFASFGVTLLVLGASQDCVEKEKAVVMIKGVASKCVHDCMEMQCSNNNAAGQIAAGSTLLIFFFCQCACVWCWWDSLQVAVAILDAAADFFISTKRIVLVSIFYFLFNMWLILSWFGFIAMIVSLNEIDAMAGVP